MRFKRLLVAAFLGFAAPLSLALPEPAQATSLVNLSTEQLVDASTWVVRGTVTEVWTEREGDLIWTRARVEVAETFKGPEAAKELVIDSLGGWHEGYVQEIISAARFSKGEEMVVFAAEIRHGARLSPVGMYLGKYTVRRGGADPRPYVIRFTQGPLEMYDHRFIPHPPEAERLHLDTLIGQIESRLDAGWDGKPIPGISQEKLAEINTPERRQRR